MSVAKVNVLLVTLTSLLIGTVGDASAQEIRMASLDSGQLLSEGNRDAIKSTTRIEITGARMASESSSPTNSSPANLTPARLSSVTSDQIENSPVEQFSQASFHQTVQPTSGTSVMAPLTSLGQNDNFAAMVENAPGVVLIDFYADWCGPCRRQGGILHEMENTARQNNASIIKVNVDQHRRLATAFNVTSMPTLVLVKDGQIIDRQTGVADHQRVASLLSR